MLQNFDEKQSTIKMADPAGTKIVEEPKKRTNRTSRSPRHSERAEERVKPRVVPFLPGKCRKKPSRIKVQPVSGSLQGFQNHHEDAQGTRIS